MMRRRTEVRRGGFGRFVVWLLVVLALAAVVSLGAVKLYSDNLRAVSDTAQSIEVTIEQGSDTSQIAEKLQQAGLIRKAWVFERYVQLKNAGRYLQAGTYVLSPSMSTPDIISQLTHGKVKTKLVSILPGQRLDQIRQSLIDQGFAESEVDAALVPGQYESMPLLANKPIGASLEGYLFPESFERTDSTSARDIVEQSLLQMDRRLTTEVRQGFARQGLTTYQGVIIASIVEKEVIVQSERAQAAQVFIKRYKEGISLGSDVTAFYGSQLAGRGQSVYYDTPYNTRLHKGLPPTPISNVSESSLSAVSNPSDTDWLFFVTGDDGTTHFSNTYEEHKLLVDKYCHELCN